MGKTHPDTLTTITCMANKSSDGLKDYAKAEEMYRRRLDGYDKSFGKEQKYTKGRAMNMAGLYIESKMNDKGRKMRSLAARCPHLVQGDASNALYIRAFIA